MQVTHYFNASLTSPVTTTIPAMQGDGVRLIVARLMEGTAPWFVPDGVTAGVSYELPDKEPGYYDRLNDGTPACVIDGNQISVVLEPVLTERAGFVKASIVLRDPDDVQVATFPFHLWVERVPGIVHGENIQAPSHVFDGKIYYGGPGGVLLPLGLGNGIRVEKQGDSGLFLVTEGGGSIAGETDPTVPEWAKQPNKPSYTAQEVGADPAGAANRAVDSHNTDPAAHADIRNALEALRSRLNAALNSEDVDLDQLAEIVAYIRSNRELIDAITTAKVSVADIVNDLVTNAANKPLSAAQGVALKRMLDELDKIVNQVTELPIVGLQGYVLRGGLDQDPGGRTWVSEPIPVTAGQRLLISGSASAMNSIWEIYDEAGKVIDYELSADAGSAVVDEPVTVPDGAASIRVAKDTWVTNAQYRVLLVGAEPGGAVAAHNRAADAHPDIRADLAKKLDADQLPAAIEDALAQAKDSGAFDGAPGYTPVKGEDYYTPAEKSEMVQAVIDALPKYAGEVS